MKLSATLLAAAAVAALSLVGCADVPADHENFTQNDTHYMHAVDTAAKKNGVDVYWINPPSKSTTATTTGS